MFGGSNYNPAESQLSSGDLLVLFTDGLTDLRNSSDELFGEDRILKSIHENRTRPLKEIAAVVLNEGRSFNATSQPDDDLTLFLVRFH
jgi:serine phosphatase RsbU (regulator of sigma subunit)